jgi:hypothetical protein
MIAIFISASGAAGHSNYFKPKAIFPQGPAAIRSPDEAKRNPGFSKHWQSPGFRGRAAVRADPLAPPGYVHRKPQFP